MVKVLVVGKGIVGSAVVEAFKKDNITVVDPRFTRTSIKDLKGKKFNIIFVCVDTPKNENFKILNTVLKEIEDYLPGSLVCVKSTASPLFLEKVQKELNVNLVFSPEYLSHWNHLADFRNQKFIIVGGKKKFASQVARILVSRLKKVQRVGVTDIKTAALIKYAENAFLAYKVTFANELYKMHKKIGCKSTYRDLINLLILDERIGSSHWQVPGRDGRFGWGGHCYEKDIYELERFTKSPLIKFLRKINKKHRKA